MTLFSRWPLIPAIALALFDFGGCRKDNGDGLVISGRVEVDNIHVGSKIGGRVARVNAEEGDSVKSGAAVVELEDQEWVAQLDQARAAAAQSQSQLDLLLSGTRKEDLLRGQAVVDARMAEVQLRKNGFREEEIREAEAEMVSAKSAHDLAERELARSNELLKNKTIDQSEFDKTLSAFETARAKLEGAKQRAHLMKSGSRPEEIAMVEAQLQQAQADLERLKNGPRPEEIAAQRSAVEAANANIKRLESQLAETKIISPVSSMVETLDLEPGDLVKAGETVAVLNLSSNPWVRCYMPENRLAFVKPGMEVRVSVDSFPGRILKGKVRRISSEAEFTPRNVQTTEKRSELVFELKVDVIESPDLLRAGMYADVFIDHPGKP